MKIQVKLKQQQNSDQDQGQDIERVVITCIYQDLIIIPKANLLPFDHCYKSDNLTLGFNKYRLSSSNAVFNISSQMNQRYRPYSQNLSGGGVENRIFQTIELVKSNITSFNQFYLNITLTPYPQAAKHSILQTITNLKYALNQGNQHKIAGSQLLVKLITLFPVDQLLVSPSLTFELRFYDYMSRTYGKLYKFDKRQFLFLIVAFINTFFIQRCLHQPYVKLNLLSSLFIYSIKPAPSSEEARTFYKAVTILRRQLKLLSKIREVAYLDSTNSARIRDSLVWDLVPIIFTLHQLSFDQILPSTLIFQQILCETSVLRSQQISSAHQLKKHIPFVHSPNRRQRSISTFSSIMSLINSRKTISSRIFLYEQQNDSSQIHITKENSHLNITYYEQQENIYNIRQKLIVYHKKYCIYPPRIVTNIILRQMCGKFTDNEKERKPVRCYLVDSKYEYVPLDQVLAERARSKESLSDSQRLQLLADLMRKGLQKSMPIITQLGKMDMPKKTVQNIMDLSQRYKDVVDYQIVRIALLAIALASLKIVKISPKGHQQQNLVELLVSFYVHRLLHEQITEAEYFKTFLKLTETDFVEDDFAALDTICKNPQYQIILERYQYLLNKPYSQGARSYLMYRLINLPNLASDQKDFLQKEAYNLESIHKGRNRWLKNEKSSKLQGKQKLFKAKIKYQLGLSAKACLDDLTGVDIKEIKDDKHHQRMYNELKEVLIEKLEKQSSPFEKAEIFCKFGMTKQLAYVISHPGQFRLNNQQVEGLRNFIGQQDQEEGQQEAQGSEHSEGEEQVPVMAQVIHERIERQDERKVKVLNIVGGGIKGLFALLLLAEMQYRTGRHVYDMFDLFVGTSIGGIICVCLASRRYTAKQLLVKILGQSKNQIFHNIRFGRNNIGRIWRLIARNSVYLQENISEVCRDLIGEIRLSQTNGWKNFLVTSVARQGDQFIPCFFYKYNHIEGINKVRIDQTGQMHIEPFQGLGLGQVTVWQILRATSAAYPLLPKIVINGTSFYDGGFMFNNPSLIAIRFLNMYQIDTANINILMIQLSRNQLGRNFNLFRIINEQSQRLRQMVQSYLIFLKNRKNRVIQRIESIAQYCSQQTIRLLGHNVIHFDLYSTFLQQRIAQLPNLQLDCIDYQAIRTLQAAAQLLIGEMDRTNDFNRICLLFQDNDAPLRQNQSFLTARISSRYKTYTSQYAQLDRLFRQGRLIATESELVRRLQSFSFPQHLDSWQKSIQLSRRIKKVPIIGGWFKEQPLVYALAIGHYHSIKHYLNNQDQINSRYFKNDWNAYHICIANDEFISLHAIIYRQLLSQQYVNPSSRAIDAAINQQLRRNTLLEKIAQLNNVLNQQGDAGVFWWYKISGRAFIEYFRASKVKRYLQMLNLKFRRQINLENPRVDMWQIILE